MVAELCLMWRRGHSGNLQSTMSECKMVLKRQISHEDTQRCDVELHWIVARCLCQMNVVCQFQSDIFKGQGLLCVTDCLS